MNPVYYPELAKRHAKGIVALPADFTS
jgi:hypothetical protein